MNKVYTYKGFKTTMLYSEEDNLYYGKLENITDLVSFDSEKPEGFYDSFVDAVEDYLEFCKQVDKKVEQI